MSSGLAAGENCYCDTCNKRVTKAGCPCGIKHRGGPYPSWVTTPGWGRWDGKKYRWEAPESPVSTEPKPSASAARLSALAKARAAKQAKREAARV